MLADKFDKKLAEDAASRAEDEKQAAAAKTATRGVLVSPRRLLILFAGAFAALSLLVAPAGAVSPLTAAVLRGLSVDFTRLKDADDALRLRAAARNFLKSAARPFEVLCCA